MQLINMVFQNNMLIELDEQEIFRIDGKVDFFTYDGIIFIADKIRRLRRLSQVKKAGYYKHPRFLKSLKKVNEEDGWGIQYSLLGKLLVTEDDIETVLRVLYNDRITSKINVENFDVNNKLVLSANHGEYIWK